MATQQEIETAIENSISMPKSFTNDGVSVTRQSVDDLIKISDHKKKANASPFGFWVRLWKGPSH